MNTAVLTFQPDGTATGLYTELISLAEIGSLKIARAASVDFNNQSQLWEVKDRAGRVRFFSPSRAVCLDWEQIHLQPHSTH